MDLQNSFEVVVHYLLIRGMTNFGNWDEFPMVITLVFVVTHWKEPMVNYDREEIEFVLKFAVILTYEWEPKMIIYSPWIGLLLMEVSNNKHSQ